MILLNTKQKNQMTALVASRPGIRTVEISDVMDCDIAPVNEALQELVDAGTLSMHDVKAPNGRDAKAFTLSGVALPAKPADGASAVPSKPAKTNIEKAIDFIAGNGGQATSSELHHLMGLKPTDYASSYLTGAISDGRLVKDGKTWTLGSGVPRSALAPAAAPTPVVEPSPVPVPAPVAAPVHAPIVVVDDQSVVNDDLARVSASVQGELPSKLTYALWSDGTMQFARDGVPVITMRKADVKKLFAYLDNFAIPDQVEAVHD